MVWVKVNEKNVVIDVSNQMMDDWIPINVEYMGLLDIVNRYDEFIWKLDHGKLVLRTNEEIMADLKYPEEDDPADIPEPEPSDSERIAALEQELELLLSGEAE